MYDIIIQAGHEGGVRNGGVKTTGTPGEIERTPRVANRMAETLQANGFSVLRVPATYPGLLEARLSVSLHFDGSVSPGSSGASMGYPAGVPAGSNKPAADQWKRIYSEVWPFKWMPDNFTANLSGYYGYKYVSTEIAEVLIELGELTDPKQRTWLDAQIASGFLGDLLAYWAGVVLGKPIHKPSLDSNKDARIQQLEAKINELNGTIASYAQRLKDMQPIVADLLARVQ